MYAYLPDEEAHCLVSFDKIKTIKTFVSNLLCVFIYLRRAMREARSVDTPSTCPRRAIIPKTSSSHYNVITPQVLLSVHCERGISLSLSLLPADTGDRGQRVRYQDTTVPRLRAFLVLNQISKHPPLSPLPVDCNADQFKGWL